MKHTMKDNILNILRTTAWWTYAVLASIITLGIWTRAHLVTVRLPLAFDLRVGPGPGAAPPGLRERST
jgi:hypothetical protein